MNTVTGIITGIDREGGLVTANVDGADVTARYVGEAPPPLATGLFLPGPAWVCLGALGECRKSFGDDFNFYTAGTPLIGGTGWSLGGSGATLTTPSDPTDGNGVLRQVQTGGQGFIRKTLDMVTLADTRCYWFAARVRQSDADKGLYLGLGTTGVMGSTALGASDAGAVFTLLASGFSNTLTSTAGTSTSQVVTGESAESNTWAWVDVMVQGGQWVAAWVDGSGPWVVTDNVPSTSHWSVTPFIASFSSGGATNNVDVDYASLHVMPADTVADPTEGGLLAGLTEDG